MHKYKKIHTTSTKCQYHAAASNPKWWPVLNWCRIVRIKHTPKKDDPINTCRPWNPVATKNVDPYTLSAIVKGASKYSPTCSTVKYTPSNTVTVSPWIACSRFPSISLWWAQVTVTPDASRTAVFNKGTLKGLMGSIPVGGHLQPISGVGASLLWKNAQKNAKKNKTSDAINKIIPHRSPLVTYDVWCPMNTPSRITSRHHWIIVRITIDRPISMHTDTCRWNQSVKPIVKARAPIEPVSGHGLNSTRWNGCRTITEGNYIPLVVLQTTACCSQPPQWGLSFSLQVINMGLKGALRGELRGELPSH